MAAAFRKVPNLKPTAKDDIIPAQRIKSDGSPDLVTPPRVKIDALANDSDTDGDTLSIVSVSAPRRGLAAIDTESGKIIYTADGLEVQNDSFTYTVSDAHGGTATASVLIQTNAGGRYEGVVTTLKDEASGDPGTVIGSLVLRVTKQRAVKGILTVHGVAYPFTGAFNRRNLLGLKIKDSPRAFLSAIGLQLHLRDNGNGWSIDSTIRTGPRLSAATCEVAE